MDKEKVSTTLDELEKKVKGTKKIKKNIKPDFKFKIVDLEKEKKEIKSNLEELEKQLNHQSTNRKSILREVNDNIDSYSNKILDYEKTISEYQIREVKFKNQEHELDEYVEMYNNKCEEYDEEVEKLNKEIIGLRKKNMANDLITSNLKSIVTILIKQYGIDRIVEITGIEHDNIEKYLQD